MKKIILLVTVLALIGCSEKPEKTVKNYFSALQSGDFKKADSYLINPQHELLAENETELFKLISKYTTCEEMKVIEATGDSALVFCNVHTVNMRHAYEEYEKEINSIMSDDPTYMPDLKDNSMFIKHIKANLDKKSTQRTYIYLEKNGSWKISAFEGEPEYEFLGNRTGSMLYLEYMDPSLCFFKEADKYYYMYCTEEQAKQLTVDQTYSVEYGVYKDIDTEMPAYELVSFTKQ